MNIIYNKAVEFLQAQENEQPLLFYELNNLVRDSMNKKDDRLNLSLEQAQQEDSALIWNTIQNHVIDIVNTFEYEKDGKQYISHLLLLPFMIFPNSNTVRLPPIEEVESWWRTSLSQYLLTYPEALEFNMAPVVLSRNNAFNMTMVDWYQIHKANSLTLNKRDTRAMFISPFTIKATEKQANLNFFVATLNFEVNASSYVPLISLNTEQTNKLEMCLFEINNNFSDVVEDGQWLSMPVGRVHNIIGHAFETYQETLLTNMIANYSHNTEIRFILIPNNEMLCTLCAWHETENIILDAVSISQYISDFSKITEYLLNELEVYEFAALYVGNSFIDIEQFNNLPLLDLDYYIKTHGVNSVLTSSEDDI